MRDKTTSASFDLSGGESKKSQVKTFSIIVPILTSKKNLQKTDFKPYKLLLELIEWVSCYRDNYRSLLKSYSGSGCVVLPLKKDFT